MLTRTLEGKYYYYLFKNKECDSGWMSSQHQLVELALNSACLTPSPVFTSLYYVPSQKLSFLTALF